MKELTATLTKTVQKFGYSLITKKNKEGETIQEIVKKERPVGERDSAKDNNRDNTGGTKDVKSSAVQEQILKDQQKLERREKKAKNMNIQATL